MNIKIKDFIIKQQESGFDLIRIVKSKRLGDGTLSKPNGKEYDKEVEIAYNIPFELCLDKIIHLTLLDKNSIVEIREFINEYRFIKNEVLNVLK
jgi:hypothetical protein